MTLHAQTWTTGSPIDSEGPLRPPQQWFASLSLSRRSNKTRWPASSPCRSKRSKPVQILASDPITDIWHLDQQRFSVPGSRHRALRNQTALQYFVPCNFKKGRSLSTGLFVTANWRNQAGGEGSDGIETTSGRWTVPCGGGVRHFMRLDYQPIVFSAQVCGSAFHPPSPSPWGMRIQLALL